VLVVLAVLQQEVQLIRMALIQFLAALHLLAAVKAELQQAVRVVAVIQMQAVLLELLVKVMLAVQAQQADQVAHQLMLAAAVAARAQ
jgi:hypothetical protein